MRRVALAAIVARLLVGCGLDIPGASQDAIAPRDDASSDAPLGAPADADDAAADAGIAPVFESGADAPASPDAGAPPDADAGPSCLAAAPGMIAWWTGDGTMQDRVGPHDGASGTEGGSQPVGYGPGRVGQGFALGGARFVEVPNAAALRPARVTMEAWIQATQLGGRVVDKIGAGTANGYLLDTYSNKLRIIVGASTLSSPANLPTGAWVHVAGTYDGATARLFVDGAEVASLATNVTIPESNLTLRLGGDSNGQNRFNGTLDEVALYDRALTAAEIAAIHAAGANGRCKD